MCTFVAKTNSENNPNQRYLQLGLASPELITFVWDSPFFTKKNPKNRLAGLSKFFQCTSTSLFSGGTF